MKALYLLLIHNDFVAAPLPPGCFLLNHSFPSRLCFLLQKSVFDPLPSFFFFFSFTLAVLQFCSTSGAKRECVTAPQD